MVERGPGIPREVVRWVAEVDGIQDDKLMVTLHNPEDDDPERVAEINPAIMPEELLSKLGRGSRFFCTTTIPPFPGKPMISDFTYIELPPLPREAVEQAQRKYGTPNIHPGS